MALVALRLGVGWQFFREGVDKIHNGFSSAGFLGVAKGPLAPLYRGMLTDPDGLALLDLKKTKSAWKDYADEAIDHYRFGYDLFEMADRVKLKRAMEAAKEEKTKREYAVQISRLNRRIEAIRQQDEQAREILAEQLAMLEAYFDEYEQDIAQYRKQLERRRRNQAPQIVEVASLRGQADRIEADLRKDRAELLAPLNTLWDDYERAITWLAHEEQIDKHGLLELERPGGPTIVSTNVVDAVVPWLDLAIGILLILGLCTRLTSIVAAAFLASIMITQWPGSIGAQPIYYQFNLMLALLVLAATGAGRWGGLDYFCSAICSRCCRSRTSTAAQT